MVDGLDRTSEAIERGEQARRERHEDALLVACIAFAVFALWFLPVSDDEVIVYSLPSLRSRNIGDGAKVALNFNSQGGGGVATFTGQARVDPSIPPVHENVEYLAKYRTHIEDHLGMTVEAFGAKYHVPIRAHLTGVRAW